MKDLVPPGTPLGVHKDAESGVVIEVMAGDPRCKGICRGERAAIDSPARYGTDPAGRKVIWCTCCHGVLRLASLKDFGPDVSSARFAAGVQAKKVRRFECPICRYDVQSIAEITGG